MTDLGATKPDAMSLQMLKSALLAVAIVLYRNQRARARREQQAKPVKA